jgi:hypothetical protein
MTARIVVAYLSGEILSVNSKKQSAKNNSGVVFSVRP